MNLAHLTQLIETYRYGILIPLSFIEGPIVAFVTGALASIGYFNIYIALVIFFLRDIILDSASYTLGRFAGKTSTAHRILSKIGIRDEHIEDIRRLWNTHGASTMFFSKLSYGLSAAFLIVAGIVKMPFTKFFEYAAFVALAQYGTLLVIGYFFGNAFGTVSSVLQNIQYAILGVTVFGTAYYFFKYYIRRKLLRGKNARG